MIRVLIADDEPLIRAATRLLLGRADDLAVVAEAADGAEAVAAAVEHAPDVALVDIRMPVLDGLGAVEELSRVAPAVRAIVLTTFGDEEYVARALRAGAAGFLLKDTDPTQILHAVRAAAAGDAVLSPPIARQVIARCYAAPDPRPRDLSSLTAREREVLALVGHGLSNAEIGARLGTTAGTVKVHVARILSKLACANRVQAAIIAHDSGLLRR
ncbi:response regulator [Actinokineospora soli]|uniref:Response regulator n=1 Tax=Actinokineospora soli TaxID=1048753 RepID=A0ABW2TU24_9PSEU